MSEHVFLCVGGMFQGHERINGNLDVTVGRMHIPTHAVGNKSIKLATIALLFAPGLFSVPKTCYYSVGDNKQHTR